MAGRQITIDFIGNDRSLGSTATSVESKFGKLGGRLDKVGQLAGKALAGGLFVAGAAAVKLGQQASDLAETQSKVVQIFGDKSAAALDKFAGKAATNLGQSKQTALDAAATFGVFGKSAGLAGKDLTHFAEKNTRLATDMASFNNTSPEEAIEALGAAFRGEAEPIRKYGVLLDDATLRQEALKLGLVKTTKEALTPQQKVLAAQSAIMKQTTDQQGDFARTSDGLANKQRILKAQMANLGTEVGAKVLPAMIKLTAVGLKMVDWVGKNERLVGTFAVALGGLLAVTYSISLAMRAWVAITKVWAVVTKVAAGVQWLLNAALTANPVGLVIVAIAALVAGMVIAYKKSETFRKIVNGAFTAVWHAAKTAFDWVKSNWPKILAVLVGPVGIAVLLIMKHWAKIKSIFSSSIAAVVGFVKTLPGKIGSALASLGSTLVGIATRAFNSFIDREKNGILNIIDLAKSIPSKVLGALGNLGNLLYNAGQAIIQGLINGIKSMAGALVSEIASSVTDKIPGFIKDKLGIHSPSILLTQIGVNIMEGLIQGIHSKRTSLVSVLEKVTGYVKAQADKLKGLISDRNSFAAGFRSFSGSVFSADFTDPETGASTASVSGLIDYQKAQKQKAASLKRDVGRLVKMGLSKDLIQQLAASGEQGIAQIHALAGGSKAQIQQLNGLNASTNSLLNAAGMRAGNSIYGDRIAQTRQNEATAAAIAKALKKHLDDRDKNTEVVLKLDGRTIQISLLQLKRKTGRALNLA